jgi:hypothetical protein
VFLQYNSPRKIRGAGESKTEEKQAARARCSPENASNTEQITSDNMILVVDGNNFIYNLMHTIKTKKYEELMYRSLSILRQNLPDANIHFVVKIGKQKINWEAFQLRLKDKKITLHIVKGANKSKKHYDKAADDILCLLIAQQFIQSQQPALNPPKIILLSNDLFRDIKDFTKTPIFSYKSMNSGITEEKTIDPSKLTLNIPINHLGISLLSEDDSKKYNIKACSVAVDNNFIQEKRQCMYLII